MPQFLGAPGDLPPPSTSLSQPEQKKGEKKKGSSGDESAAALAARLLASSYSSHPNSFASLPRSVGSAAWSRCHALLEELNARAHADAAKLSSGGRGQKDEEEEAVPLALSGAATATGEEGARAAEGGIPSPLAAVAAHLLVASSWRARALPSILRALEEKRLEREGESERGDETERGSERKAQKKEEEKEETEDKDKEKEKGGAGGDGDWFLSLYGLLRHDVSCANLLAVALSAPAAAATTKALPSSLDSDRRRSAVAPLLLSLPPAVRALREGDDPFSVSCALAAWAARSVRWWDAAEGGRAAAARTAAATRAAAVKTKMKANAAGSSLSLSSSFSPSLAADETALAAAASALAVFRCLAQHAEDLPPGVGAVLSGSGAGDLVPVLVRRVERENFSLFFFLSLLPLSFPRPTKTETKQNFRSPS